MHATPEMNLDLTKEKHLNKFFSQLLEWKNAVVKNRTSMHSKIPCTGWKCKTMILLFCIVVDNDNFWLFMSW